jgi:hemerythrin
MLRWKQDYLIGIDQVDVQHEKLFEIAERAYQLLKDEFRTDKYDEIVKILEELKEYTIFHFKFEEEYMMSIGYKKFFSHKVQHNDFMEAINNADLNNIDKNQEEYILGLLEFVVKWIDEHILSEDKLIAAAK